MYLNNKLLSDMGVFISTMSNWLTASRSTPSFLSVAGSLEQLASSYDPAQARLITVRASIYPGTLGGREASIAALETALRGRCLFRTTDRPSTQTVVYCIGVTYAPRDDAPQLVDALFECEITFVALYGGSEDYIPPPPLAITSTATPVSLGTLPSGGWLFAYGGTSPLTITYASANGSLTTTLVVTGTLATGEHFALDLDRQDVWKVTAAGVRTRFAAVSGTWPALDPIDAAGTAMPTLAVSSGTAILSTRRRWRV